MNRKLTISTLLALMFSFQVQAHPAFLRAFKAQYPKTTLNDCLICHANQDDYERNAYGQDVENNISKGVPNFKAIEQLDSDGDGFTNIQEINAGSFPGDPTSVPAPVGA